MGHASCRWITIVIDAPADQLTQLPAATVPFTTSVMARGVPSGSLVPPVVELTWDGPSTLAAMPVPEHDAYLADLRDWGVNHPFVFWKDTNADYIRIAPLGRWTDVAHAPLDAEGRFSTRLETLDATIEGKLSVVGPGLRIDQGKVTIGDAQPIGITVQGEYLPPVPTP